MFVAAGYGNTCALMVLSKKVSPSARCYLTAFSFSSIPRPGVSGASTKQDDNDWCSAESPQLPILLEPMNPLTEKCMKRRSGHSRLTFTAPAHMVFYGTAPFLFWRLQFYKYEDVANEDGSVDRYRRYVALEKEA